MSEEIKVLTILGVALLVAVLIFMRCCKADGYFVIPKPSHRPPNLPIGTKVYATYGDQIMEGVIVDIGNFKYIVEMYDAVTGNKMWYITSPDDVWVRKGDIENE